MSRFSLVSTPLFRVKTALYTILGLIRTDVDNSGNWSFSTSVKFMLPYATNVSESNFNVSGVN
jgi:hypothetical protein